MATRRLLATVATNSDGRCDGPLLQGPSSRPGNTSCVFHVGDYLRAGGLQLSDPPFLDLVPLRFGIADAATALPCAAAGLALRLLDLPRQLTLERDGQRRRMHPMRDRVRFLLGHELVELDQVDPTQTVLDWLRLARRRTGTKEGCNEGDCGACTVVVAKPNGARLDYRAVNACIQFVATLDGCQLLTVEDLKAADGSLHPVQQAMVDCHGSQCGFCTPGFVMSMFALTRTADTLPGEEAIDDALAGNLCRCTGYAPIVRAVQQSLRRRRRAPTRSRPRLARRWLG